MYKELATFSAHSRRLSLNADNQRIAWEALKKSSSIRNTDRIQEW